MKDYVMSYLNVKVQKIVIVTCEILIAFSRINESDSKTFMIAIRGY
jgi:hypothetical protein